MHRQSAKSSAPPQDPYEWLEDVEGEAALGWVRAQNAVSRSILEAQPGFAASRLRLRTMLDAPTHIPYVYRDGSFFINFWQDEANPRGLWRRTPLNEYLKSTPEWEVLLDLDAFAVSEGENWVWAGEHSLGGNHSRSLVQLSRGGGDAVVIREFDTTLKQFIPDGFYLPEAKTQISWLNPDQVLVATDTGPESLTDSGYPRTLRLWHRGQRLSDAPLIFEGQWSDMLVDAHVDHTPGFERVVLQQVQDFYSSQVFLWQLGEAPQKLNKPDDAELHFWRDRVLIQLRSDWNVTDAEGLHTWPSGSLLVADASAFVTGRPEFTALFTPSATTSLADYSLTRNHVLIEVLDNVVGKLQIWSCDNGAWQQQDVPTPPCGTLSVSALHDPLVGHDPWADKFFVYYCNFLTPDSVYLGAVGQEDLQLIKSGPSFFDASQCQVEQHFASSRDGTQVPYFLIAPRHLAAHGRNPTVLTGYGGFEVSQQPWYLADFGSEWLAKGGVLAVANVRGGGEYGPRWHQAALGSNRQKSFDDFTAIAEDLIARRVTSPRHLGIQGGSNGGLLVAAAMVQRPELFQAVLCQVPLLDMQRFHRLAAGASWIAEYGDPDDPDDWAALSAYSPYHNLNADARYPTIFLVTSTLDDRVHPGHARKMAAKMLAQGHRVLYHETVEGGHGATANHEQAADLGALEFAFLWQLLR